MNEAVGPAMAFVGGLLTALTPCVYPVIPITVATFGEKTGSLKRRVALASVFVLAMAGVYSGLGALAAWGGGLFGEIGASPVVRILGGLLLVGLGLSFFGLYELRLPARLQSALARVARGGRPLRAVSAGPTPFGASAVRAGLLGAVSGLLAASCTGPVLAALISFAGTSGEPTFGFTLLLLFAIGMGLPFFALAVLIEKLPRPGRWLRVVKVVLGIAVVASGVALAAQAVSAAPAATSATANSNSDSNSNFPAPATAPDEIDSRELRVESFFFPNADFFSSELRVSVPPWLLLSSPAPVVTWQIIPTTAALDAALARAKTAAQPVVIDFFASWCAECREMDKTIFSRDDVRAALRPFATLRVDATTVTAETRAIARRYKLSGVPAVVFVNAHGIARSDLTLAGVPTARAFLAAVANQKRTD